MFVCVECGHLFEEPVWWTESHGFDSPPYEKIYGSPCCYGAYTEAHQCNECDEWITGEYIKTASGQRICENCYDNMEIGEEN